MGWGWKGYEWVMSYTILAGVFGKGGFVFLECSIFGDIYRAVGNSGLDWVG